ncbi:MAG: hypothetical protein J6C16_04200 [Clostridia bacterium]|nr:hypothetical protein [Clostridia bacterium]
MNKIKGAIFGMIILLATQIAPKLVIYAIVLGLVVYFVRLMMNIINEC